MPCSSWRQPSKLRAKPARWLRPTSSAAWPLRLKGEFDLVTEADRASEKLMVERLRTYFPSHAIVAEEGGGHEGSSEYRWFVDPLDGTTNFAHSFPMFCVTHGPGARGRDHRRSGLRSDPPGGIYRRARLRRISEQPPCSTSRIGKVANSLASTGFPSRKRHHNVNIHFYYQLAMASHGVRRTGSAALDLAYVASGRLDFFWEFGLKPWDMAAGALLVQEAGGRVSDMTGAPLSLTASDNILADNGALHGEILASFAEIFQGHERIPLPAL